MTEQQIQYIELYSFKKKNYPEIEKEMNISRKELRALLTHEVMEYRQHIQKIYKKYNKERSKAFPRFKDFFNWYEKQEQICGYCGVSQVDLYKIFKKNNGILPYIIPTKEYEKEPKRSSGTLEIERLDSSEKYGEDNIILACPLCNNAKSNLIDEVSWRELFVPAMKAYYKKLLITIN